MMDPHEIALLAFDSLQMLDVTGPAAVFAAANDACGRPYYRMRIVSAAGGAVVSNSGLALLTIALEDVPVDSVDTLLVSGGDEAGLRRVAATQEVRDWVVATAACAQRYGSVCNGALVLGDFGLLDGKRVATHWDACATLTRSTPAATVDPNALYIEDGDVWTSAGVTTGIDMSLAMVEKDLGGAIAQTIAERLVLYARRPGYQSQFSPMLSAQARAGSLFNDLIEWMKGNLTEGLDVHALAARVAMSERSFHRKFTSAIGETPGHFVESLRLDHSRHLLAANLSLKQIADQAGFSTPAHFSKAFERRFGVTPSFFRELRGHTLMNRSDSEGSTLSVPTGPGRNP